MFGDKTAKMNPPIINSTNSVSTSTKRKREAERSVNWTVEETQVLLCAWSDERVQKSLAENVRNRHVFKHLSARMCDLGFSRSPHQCRLRVKTLKANYVRAKLLKSVDDSQPCSFRYYEEMDAVLGRKAVEGIGGCHYGSVEGIGGRQSRYLGSEVKIEEDREASTEEYEFSGEGFTRPLADRRHDVFLEPTVHPGPIGFLVEDDLSNRYSSPPPPASPPPPTPPPPPQPASPVPLPPDPNLTPGTIPAAHSQALEPALKHLADCFQRLVSESRQLLVQLESQRQEQARWQQDLLAKWLERDDRRQREAADRDDRREKARMEHELRVLQLLTGLVQQRPHHHYCQCSRVECAGAATTSQRNRTDDRDRSESHAL